MKRPLTLLAGMLLVQALLVAAYFAVEARRDRGPPLRFEALDLPAPLLVVEGPDGPRSLEDLRGRAVLVHFWATWCAPCREELPDLLAAAREHDLALLAVTDEDWPAVRAFFDGEVPAAVVRDPSGDATRRWQVSGLPDTFVVDPTGRVVARMGGPRRWLSDQARGALVEWDSAWRRMESSLEP